MTHVRLSPHVAVKKPSPNVSSRLGAIELIVLHDTECKNIPASAKDLEGVADWFANPVSQVSAHVITDADGQSARCVPDQLKAWACVSYNSASLNIEQIGFATQGAWEKAELLETARWIAQWSHEHGIPIRRAWVRGGAVIRSGVTTHKKLGIEGGGHVDPGPKYPLREVLKLARRIKRDRY